MPACRYLESNNHTAPLAHNCPYLFISVQHDLRLIVYGNYAQSACSLHAVPPPDRRVAGTMLLPRSLLSWKIPLRAFTPTTQFSAWSESCTSPGSGQPQKHLPTLCLILGIVFQDTDRASARLNRAFALRQQRPSRKAVFLALVSPSLNISRGPHPCGSRDLIKGAQLMQAAMCLLRIIPLDQSEPQPESRPSRTDEALRTTSRSVWRLRIFADRNIQSSMNISARPEAGANDDRSCQAVLLSHLYDDPDSEGEQPSSTTEDSQSTHFLDEEDSGHPASEIPASSSPIYTIVSMVAHDLDV